MNNYKTVKEGIGVMKVKSYVIEVSFTETAGGPIGMYITDKYTSGTYNTASEKSKRTDYSFWISRARRFKTREEAEQFIKDHNMTDAWIRESVRYVDT